MKKFILVIFVLELGLIRDANNALEDIQGLKEAEFYDKIEN